LIQAVVFDIGGVLERNPPTLWRPRWETRLGLQPGTIDARLEDIWRDGSIGAIESADFEQALSERLGIDPAELVEEIWSEYLGQPNEPMQTYFAGLRPRWRTAILSNSFVGAREREERRYGFSRMCETIVYSHEEGLKKPDPRFYALLCNKLGLPPESVVFLDDVPANAAAAQAFGIRPVLYENEAQAIAAIDELLGTAPSGKSPRA